MMQSGQQRWRLKMFLMFAAFIGGAMLMHPEGIAIVGHRFSGFCLFKAISGIPCPACGMTRSIHRAIEGDCSGSFSQHPLGLAVGLTVLLAFCYFGIALLLNSRLPVMWVKEIRTFHFVEVILAVALAACWLLRIF